MNAIIQNQNPPTPDQLAKYASIVSFKLPRERRERLSALQSKWQRAFDLVGELGKNGEVIMSQRQQADLETALENGGNLPTMQPRSAFFEQVRATIEGLSVCMKKYTDAALPDARETLAELSALVKSRIERIESAERASATEHGVDFVPSPTLGTWLNLCVYLERFVTDASSFSSGSGVSPHYLLKGLLP